MSNKSHLAHEEIKPKKLSIEQQIQAYLKEKGATSLQMVEFHLGLKNQTASARLSEMHDKGIVTFDPYGAYRLTYNEEEQQHVILERKREKRDKWIAQGYKNNWIEQIYAVVPEGGGKTEVRMIFANK
jgi:hypothetical protein